LKWLLRFRLGRTLAEELTELADSLLDRAVEVGLVPVVPVSAVIALAFPRTLSPRFEKLARTKQAMTDMGAGCTARR